MELERFCSTVMLSRVSTPEQIHWRLLRANQKRWRGCFTFYFSYNLENVLNKNFELKSFLQSELQSTNTVIKIKNFNRKWSILVLSPTVTFVVSVVVSTVVSSTKHKIRNSKTWWEAGIKKTFNTHKNRKTLCRDDIPRNRMSSHQKKRLEHYCTG